MRKPFDKIETELNEMEHYVKSLERRFAKPFRILDKDKVRGARFGKPDILHYVVINLANSISTLHSVTILLESGFSTQAMMLMRFVLEQNSKLSYVINGVSHAGVDKKTRNFLDEYFADNDRSSSNRPRYQPIRQKDIHRRNSEKITKDLENLRKIDLAKNLDNHEDKFAKLLSSIYSTFSNCIHGRYPEAMEIYGEFSSQLEMNGNFQSKDIDERYEVELVQIVVGSTRKYLKLALLNLQTAKIVVLSEKEAHFALQDIF